MFINVNPGLLTTPEQDPLLGIVLFLTALVFIGVFAFIVWSSSKREEGDASTAETLAPLPLIIGFSFLMSALIVPTVQYGVQKVDVATEYVQDIREWLNSDYDIDITEAEASKLAGDQQIAVELDGDLTAIHLIDGPAETVQVQIVGGSILMAAE